MPWEEDEGKYISRLNADFSKFDTGGGLHQVPGIARQVYFPSWAINYIWVGDINNVRRAYFMFYNPNEEPVTTPTISPTSEIDMNSIPSIAEIISQVEQAYMNVVTFRIEFVSIPEGAPYKEYKVEVNWVEGKNHYTLILSNGIINVHVQVMMIGRY
jgi:hypothetical protein